MYTQTNGSQWRTLLVLCALTLLSLAPLAEAQTDLVFLIDGSGSIDEADFELERQGLINALENPLVLPRGGLVSLAVIQFAGITTLVEVELTTIDDEADVAAVVDRLNAMVQLGSNTNPGDAIARASEILDQGGRAGARKNICLATDGVTNAGISVESAVNGAKSSPSGLDRFAVIAVEDPPTDTFAEDFDEEYGPHVFGGGNVTVVRNAAEFANTVGPACLGDPIRLVGLEVNQAIQDWTDSIPVIEGKTTYVRAHVETDSTDPVQAVARLRGVRNGNPLPGSPLVPDNPTGSIRVPTDAAAVRGDLNRSFYFKLPDTWLEGTIELTMEGVGTGLDCRDAADAPNDCAVEVTFVEAETPEVRYVSIEWSQGGQTYRVSEADVTELINRQVAITPAAAVDAEREFMAWSGSVPPDLLSVNLRLEWMRLLDGCWFGSGCERLYYGVLKAPSDLGGSALFAPGRVSSGSMPDLATSYGAYRHVHEFGHSLGLRHAPNCGAMQPISTLPYEEADIGNQRVTTLGPMGAGDDRLVYGLDSHRIRAVDPNRIFELMSYCGNLTGTERWISHVTYDAMRQAIGDRFDNSTVSPASARSQHSGDDYLVVRGIVDETDGSIQLLPFGSLTSAVAPPQPPPGEFEIRLLDAVGAELHRQSFEPTSHERDRPVSGADPLTRGSFLVPIPAHSAAAKVEVRRNGTLLASSQASGALPAVDILAPDGGEVLGDEEVTIQWQGQDVDGDTLSYVVQYSRDSGSTWKTLAVDWPETSYTIERRFLAGSDRALVRVQASDGFHTRTDPSDNTFSVVNNPPQVEILSPRGGDTFSGVQLLHLDARATDREDGRLDGDSLTWSSSLDGPLGEGTALVLTASDLTEGRHRIALTATDSRGDSTTRTVTIDVGRLAAQGCLPDDDTLCLNNGRFAVEIEWADFNGNQGPGTAVTNGTVDSGMFWFFDEDNWEVLVKVIDGCIVNDRFWFFAAAPTTVEYSLRVVDTFTGSTTTYRNPARNASPAITDTDAFASCNASAPAAHKVEDLGSSDFRGQQVVRTHIPAPATTPASSTDCVDSETELCLGDQRFQVEVTWRDFFGNTGSGRLAPARTDDSGVFWFFRDSNWEFLVKTVDGCSMNSHHWVFAGAATNVEYTLKVTDTVSGEAVEYRNPLGDVAVAINDTQAFSQCP